MRSDFDKKMDSLIAADEAEDGRAEECHGAEAFAENAVRQNVGD